jgi:hypothetical protein
MDKQEKEYLGDKNELIVIIQTMTRIVSYLKYVEN